MFTLHLQVELTHLGIAVIMDEYNDISRCPLDLRSPDGVHLVENALWRTRHYNYLAQVCSLFVSSVLWTIVGLHQ